MPIQGETQAASVRLPAEMKKELRIRAAMNDVTLSDEIVSRLGHSLSEEKVSLPMMAS